MSSVWMAIGRTETGHRIDRLVPVKDVASMRIAGWLPFDEFEARENRQRGAQT